MVRLCILARARKGLSLWGDTVGFASVDDVTAWLILSSQLHVCFGTPRVRKVPQMSILSEIWAFSSHSIE